MSNVAYNKDDIYGKIEKGNIDSISVGEKLFFEHKYHEALNVIKSEADEGNIRAMILLAEYYDGCYNEVKYNEGMIHKWLKKAMESDDVLALFEAAFHGLREISTFNEVFDDIANMAKKGDTWAQNCLGWVYYGGICVKVNYNEAYIWFKKSAEKGCASAQHGLYFCNLHGNGCKANASKAFELCSANAKTGYLNSMYEIGFMYEVGHGCKKSLDLARKWYSQAVKFGHQNAAYRLSRIS